MKTFFVISACVMNALTLVMPSNAMSNAPSKHALIVAIGLYPTKETGWDTISSNNDVPLIRNALVSQGFTDIAVLRDQDATRIGIVAAIRSLASRVQKGDIVVLHFSAHGQQIFDDNGDEVDGLDEAIVPYDAPMRYVEGYKGEKHLRDDKLGDLIEDLRRRLGPTGDMLVFLDACHSGTGTRGSVRVRGGAPPLVPPGFIFREEERREGLPFIERTSKSSRGDDELAPFVAIAASKANELNFEANDDSCGSLSKAISKTLHRPRKGMSYRGLFEDILAEMNTIAPNQRPGLEGNVDRELFGGAIVPQKGYYTITSFNDDQSLTIDGGKLVGVFEGAKVAFHAPGSPNPDVSKPLTTGRVVSAHTFSSVVKLDPQIELPKNSWVFITERAFGDMIVQASIDSLSHDIQEPVRHHLKEAPVRFVSEKHNPELRLLPNEGKSRGSQLVSIKTVADGHTYMTSVIVDQLAEIVQNYVQCKFIKEVSLTDPELRVELDLIPVKVSRIGDQTKVDTLDAQTVLRNGFPEFSTTDAALIRVRNTGTKPAYFNIIDIQPNGIINPVVPNPAIRMDQDEYRLVPGQTYIVPRTMIRFSPPYGTETFKLFATTVPINFGPIIASRGNVRGNLSPLEELLRGSFKTRGADSQSLPESATGTTSTYIFRIIPERPVGDAK